MEYSLGSCLVRRIKTLLFPSIQSDSHLCWPILCAFCHFLAFSLRYGQSVNQAHVDMALDACLWPMIVSHVQQPACTNP